MYKHFILPLDGSGPAEAAVPVSRYLAQKLHAKITLLHIIEQDPPQKIHGEPHLRNYNETLSYLTKIREKKYPPEMDVGFHIHEGSRTGIAEAIAGHKMEISGDLIVMATHGWGGIREILSGNIAQQIVNLNTMPVLFIPPVYAQRINKTWPERILVPLDGTDEHKAGFKTALSIAGLCGSEIHLVLIIPTLNTLSAIENPVGMLLPAATKELLDQQENEAGFYLDKKRHEIEKKGIKVITEISRGEPSASIAGIADKSGADLIIIGTHGKAGLSAFWSGSFGAKLTKKTETALLFVPV